MRVKVARLFAIEEGRRPARSADGLVLLSGRPLREAKQRLLSGLFQRPDMSPYVERNGITGDRFGDNPEWREAFDLVRSGADIQGHVVKNPTGEIARLWQLAEGMSASEMLSLARQIVASVRAEEAAAKASETALESADAVDPDGGHKAQSEVLGGEVIRANAEPTPQTETENGATETANKAAASTELSTEFDMASVLPECLPLLLELDRLKTAEQKRFDSIPSLIAFERECLALKLDDQPGDVVDAEFKEVQVAEADKLPSSAPVQPAIGSAAKPPSRAIEGAMSAAISATMVAPAAAPSNSPCVESALPDTQHSSEAVERAHGQLQSMDQTAASERSTAMRPLPTLPAVLDSSAAETKVLAVEDTLLYHRSSKWLEGRSRRLTFRRPEMRSPRKAANRKNSAQSTGPKTAAGKQRARANALRHGLASVVQRDPATSAEVERLARWICGNDANPSQYEHARTIAEEQIMLRRVDAAYVAIIERATEIARGGANQLQTKFGVATHHELPAGAPSPATPDVLEALALALPQLTKLDRYQQRALARRQRATRAFVAASVLPGADNSNIE